MSMVIVVTPRIAVSTACGQTAGTVVFQREYLQIPFPLRVDNSGIYCTASYRLKAGSFVAERKMIVLR